MRKDKTVRLLAGVGLVALLAIPATSFAQGTMGTPSGGTGGTPGSSGTTTSTMGPDIDATHMGGNSSTHMSTEGQMNTNGPNATDRSYGKDRACDRHQMHSGSSTTGTTGMNCPTGSTPGTAPGTMNNSSSGTTDTTPDSSTTTPE